MLGRVAGVVAIWVLAAALGGLAHAGGAARMAGPAPPKVMLAMVVADELVIASRPVRLTSGMNLVDFEVSPDGRYIVLLDKPAKREGTAEVMQGLRMLVIALGGGSARVLQERAGVLPPTWTRDRRYILRAFGWSADGQFLAVRWPDPEDVSAHRADLFVYDVRTWQAISAPLPGRVGEFLAWQPDGRWLAFSVEEQTTRGSKGMLILWDPRTNEVRRIGVGSRPRWSSDGRELRYDGVQHYVTEAGREGSRHGELLYVLADESRTWLASRLELSLAEGLGQPPYSVPGAAAPGGAVQVFRFVQSADSPVRLEVRDTKTGEAQVIAWDAEPIAWAPDERLLLYRLRRELRDEVRNLPRGETSDLWVYSATTGSPYRSLPVALGVAPNSITQWAPHKLSIYFVRDGDLWRVDLVAVEPSLEEKARYGLRFTSDEAREWARINVGRVGQALLLAVEDFGGRMPTGQELEDWSEGGTLESVLQRYLQNLPRYAALTDPNGKVVVEFLALPGARLDDLLMPGTTPLLSLAWPRGYVAVVFVHGHAQMFTDAEWEQFVEAAKREGRWPPDW